MLHGVKIHPIILTLLLNRCSNCTHTYCNKCYPAVTYIKQNVVSFKQTSEVVGSVFTTWIDIPSVTIRIESPPLTRQCQVTCLPCGSCRLLGNKISLLARLVLLIVMLFIINTNIIVIVIVLKYLVTLFEKKNKLKNASYSSSHLRVSVTCLPSCVGLQTNCCVQIKCAASTSACSLSFTRRPR